MRCILAIALTAAGCTTITNNYIVIADGSEPEVDTGVGEDLQLSSPGADLRAEERDLAQPGPQDLAGPSRDLVNIDFELAPGCGGTGLPTGATCQFNADCCHGLCSVGHSGGYQCCFAKGTLCSSDNDCCTINFGQPTSGACVGNQCQ